MKVLIDGFYIWLKNGLKMILEIDMKTKYNIV